MGRSLTNTMVNLGLQSSCDEALYQVTDNPFFDTSGLHVLPKIGCKTILTALFTSVLEPHHGEPVTGAPSISLIADGPSIKSQYGLLQTKLDKTLAANPKNKVFRILFIFMDMFHDGLS